MYQKYIHSRQDEAHNLATLINKHTFGFEMYSIGHWKKNCFGIVLRGNVSRMHSYIQTFLIHYGTISILTPQHARHSKHSNAFTFGNTLGGEHHVLGVFTTT